MSLLKCPKCGEMFSDSYKTCPFCEEDEAFANGGKKPVNPGRRVHRQKSPSILGPTLVLVLVLPVPEPVLVLVLQEWDHEQQLEEQQLEVAHLLEQRVSVRKT